ncbi:MAG: hypothetical protein IJS01_13175 [Lentisphaeria bacterium]|nr:hypothetical protein [Lentisphaeria bacterium]
MKHRIVHVLLFAALASAQSVLLSGCRSGRYYQAEAAQTAREFLLANAPELSVRQVYFVKYNDPMLLTAPVLGAPRGGSPEEETTNSEQQQICVTWNIPGSRYLYMVFGVSDSRMYSWRPIRLIRKDFYQKPMPEDAAVALCREYAVSSLYYSLSARDLNTIRFTFPTIIRSDFELNFNVDGKLSAEEVREAKAAAEKLFQYTLVWPNEDGSSTVFCGLGQLDMNSWKINFAGIAPADDLKAHTLGVVRTPDKPDENITPLERDRPAPAERVKEGR